MARLEPKAAAETRNYTFNWATFLGEDTIASYVVTASGVTIVADTNNDTSVTVVVEGGTDNTVARITNTITTTDGLVETEVFTLPINAGEPVTLAEAKAQLRVLDSSEDTLIASYITTAREWVEAYTGHILVRREVTDSFDGFASYLELSYRPVIEVGDISYTDTGGANQVLTDFAQTTGRYPFRVYPDAIPAIETNSTVTVAYTAGYAAGEEPQRLVQAMLVLIAGMHANRGSIPPETARTAEWLCDQHRAVL